ncbi:MULTISPECIES: hypothetical protein [Streptomyces]|uniref:Uncharacterized protein n=1 Tax=Streptomyces lienomycini TaxID=284035 RepID=A0ABV9X589_9ACTN|nr:hypothetical protein [Streptomyces sp. NBC_00334]
MRSRVLGSAAALGTAALLLGSLGATPAGAAPHTSASACAWTRTTLPLTPGAVFGEVHATDHHGGASGLIRNDPALPDGLGSWKDGAASLDRAGVAFMTYEVIDQNGSGTYVANSTYGWITGPVYGAVAVKDGQITYFPSYEFEGVLDIAENGDVTGWTKRGTATSNPTTHILRWNADRPTEFTELGQVPDFPVWDRPVDADEDGAVLYSVGSSSSTRNYVLRDGRSIELKNTAGLEKTTVDAISNGRVVGHGVHEGKRVGVLWDNDGTVTVLPNSENSGELEINKSGMIVGGASSAADGIPVWQLGTFVTRVGGAGDVARTVGDDGTIGGLTVTPAGADLRPPKGTPALWHCG